MTPERVSALIALGGNIGDVAGAMQAALGRLHAEPGTSVVSVSPIYSTPPWGITEQPRFLNACAELETSIPPEVLLQRVLAAERGAGRKRLRRWGPRTLDIDILAYGDQAIETPTLTVPHPRMFERAFVLVPLADIAGDRMIGGRRVTDALEGLDTSGIIRTDDLLSLPRAA